MQGEITCWSLLGVKGFKIFSSTEVHLANRSGMLLEVGTRVPEPVYYEHSTRLCCLGIEMGKPKKS